MNIKQFLTSYFIYIPPNVKEDISASWINLCHVQEVTEEELMGGFYKMTVKLNNERFRRTFCGLRAKEFKKQFDHFLVQQLELMLSSLSI